MIFAPVLALLCLGAPLPEDVTLQDVLNLLREQSTRTASLRAEVDIAATDIIAASVLPNPSVSYGGLFLTTGTNTGAAKSHEIRAEQPLLLFGQRGIRREVAERGVESAQAGLAVSYAERSAEVRTAFAALQAKQGSLQTIAATKEDIDRVATIVKGRAASGDRSPYDALRIDVEAQTIAVEFTNAVAEVNDAAGKLATLVAQPNWRPHAKGELRANEATPDTHALWETALSHKPALIAAQRTLATANASLTLARRERLPVPELTGGVTVTQDAKSLSTFVGLAIPIPMFDWGQGPIARADAEARRAALEAEATRAEAEADLQRAVAVLQERTRALQSLEYEVAERLPAMRKMAEASYREGQGGILELLDAFRTMKELQLRRYDQLEAVKVAEVDLMGAAGLLDAP